MANTDDPPTLENFDAPPWMCDSIQDNMSSSFDIIQQSIDSGASDVQAPSSLLFALTGSDVIDPAGLLSTPELVCGAVDDDSRSSSQSNSTFLNHQGVNSAASSSGSLVRITIPGEVPVLMLFLAC
jgi:hypothetical protein